MAIIDLVLVLGVAGIIFGFAYKFGSEASDEKYKAAMKVLEDEQKRLAAELQEKQTYIGELQKQIEFDHKLLLNKKEQQPQ